MNPENFESESVNITPLYTYYTSSESSWEKYNVGHPLDGYMKNDRFSFHTEEEFDPFIVMESIEPITVTGLQISLRKGYENKMLPLVVMVSFDRVNWTDVVVSEVTDNESSIYIENTFESIKYIKIKKSGYSCLYLSSVAIFTSHKYLNRNVSRIVSPFNNRFVLSYTPFYGLGGQLAVLATSLGYLQISSHNNIFWHWRDYQSGLVDFPPELPSGEYIETTLEEGLSSTILAHFKGENLRQRSSKGVPSWLPPSTSSSQNRPVVCISRDDIQQFQTKSENAYDCMRRLYQKIKPSFTVLNMVKQIENEFNILNSSYENTLGLQVRHGNGECYNSGLSWGVKPPSVSNLITAIDDAVLESKLNIICIIIASDSFAIRDTLKDYYKGKYVIKFISTEIQDIGGGSNPSPAIFDNNVNRKNIDMKLDDQRAFAELLILSKCIAICGGKSFFFNATIGFSQCELNRIYRINNLDRYINLPETFKLLQKNELEENKEVTEKVYNIFKNKDLSVDGVFIDYAKLPDIVSLSFFDQQLLECDASRLNDKIINKQVSNELKELRFY